VRRASIAASRIRFISADIVSSPCDRPAQHHRFHRTNAQLEEFILNAAGICRKEPRRRRRRSSLLFTRGNFAVLKKSADESRRSLHSPAHACKDRKYKLLSNLFWDLAHSGIASPDGTVDQLISFKHRPKTARFLFCTAGPQQLSYSIRISSKNCDNRHSRARTHRRTGDTWKIDRPTRAPKTNWHPRLRRHDLST